MSLRLESDEPVVGRASEDAGARQPLEHGDACGGVEAKRRRAEATGEDVRRHRRRHGKAGGQPRQDRVGLDQDVCWQRGDRLQSRRGQIVLLVPRRQGGDDRAGVGSQRRPCSIRSRT